METTEETQEKVATWQREFAPHGLLIADDGSVRFTGKHRAELAPYLAMAGIDIATVKTMDDYLAARQAASPYFIAFLVRRVQRPKPCLERKLLIAILTGDEPEQRKLRMQLATRKAEEACPRRHGTPR